MRIDKRKTKQYFKGLSGKDVYVWKGGKDNYNVGINGTSLHSSGLTHYEAENMVAYLVTKIAV